MKPEKESSVLCSVERSPKLPSAVLAESEVCGTIVPEINGAARAAGLTPGAVTIKVELLSAHSMTATIFVEGKALPQHRVDISDRPLGASAVGMLARSIASQVAQFQSSRK